MALPSYAYLSEGLTLGDIEGGEQTNPSSFSRDQITVTNPTGGTVNLPVGTVLGKLTATGFFTQLAPGASDGSQTAAGILGTKVTLAASASTVVFGLTRNATLKDVNLTWPAGITGNQTTAAIAQLAAIGLIVRRTA
jgi:hypothetical protein